MNAIESIFPAAKNLLCGWHIKQNVLAHSKIEGVYTVDTDEEVLFITDWQSLVASRTEDDYNKEWNRFKRKYLYHIDFLTYLQDTQIDNHKKKFICY